MNIRGVLTNTGIKYLNDAAINGRKMYITGMQVGSGSTPATATRLVDGKTSLTTGEQYVEDGVRILPATLVITANTAAYTITEIGVGARQNTSDPSSLFKVYKLETPIPVSGTMPQTIKFLFRDLDVMTAEYSVKVVSDAVLTQETYLEFQRQEQLGGVPTENVVPTDLSKYLQDLPRFLEYDYIIKMPAEIYNLFVKLDGFYGPGSITIDGAYDGNINTRGRCMSGVSILNCSAPIRLKNITSETNSFSSLIISKSKNVTLDNARIGTGYNPGSFTYLLDIRDSQVYMLNSVFLTGSGNRELYVNNTKLTMCISQTNLFLLPGDGTFKMKVQNNSQIIGLGKISSPNWLLTAVDSVTTFKDSIANPIATVRIY